MTDLPPLLRARHLADLLGFTVHSVNEMLRRGTIPASKIGGRWIVRRERFVAFLERCERASRAPSPAQRDPARLLRALPAPHRRGVESHASPLT